MVAGIEGVLLVSATPAKKQLLQDRAGKRNTAISRSASEFCFDGNGDDAYGLLWNYPDVLPNAVGGA